MIYCNAQRIMSCFDTFMSSSRRSCSFISSMPSYSPSVIRNVSLIEGASLTLNTKGWCAAPAVSFSWIPGVPGCRSSGIPDSRIPGFPDSRTFGVSEFRSPGYVLFLSRVDWGGMLFGRRSKELLVELPVARIRLVREFDTGKRIGWFGH